MLRFTSACEVDEATAVLSALLTELARYHIDILFLEKLHRTVALFLRLIFLQFFCTMTSNFYAVSAEANFDTVPVDNRTIQGEDIHAFVD